MRARLPSERRSSSYSTGTMQTVSVPSRSATSVLNTRAGSRPSASAASIPYDAAFGSCSYSCSVNATPARLAAVVAGVSRPAMAGASLVRRPAPGLALARTRAHVLVDRPVERALALAPLALRPLLVLERRHLGVCVLEGRDEPQARRVDEQRAAGKRDELAADGRVPAAVVARADRRRGLALLAEQRVEQRRLADAGRAEQDGGEAGREERAEGAQPGAGRRAQGEDGR